MTLQEAKVLLSCGDLETLYKEKPAGASLKQIFLDCISCSSGAELDIIVDKCLAIKRRASAAMQMWLIPTETDFEFRERAERYAYVLDTFYPKTGSENDKKPCTHSWKLYRGLMDQYEYCVNCDEKRNK